MLVIFRIVVVFCFLTAVKPSSDFLDITIVARALARGPEKNYFRGYIGKNSMTTDVSIGRLYKDEKKNISWADTGHSGDLNQTPGDLNQLSIDLPDDRVLPPPGSIIYSVDEDFMYLGVKDLSREQDVGVFTFEVSKNDVITRSAVVVTRYLGSVTTEYRTLTVGVGESATINLDRGSSSTWDFHWIHNYGPEIMEWRRLKTVTVDNVRAKDDGVYQCYLFDEYTRGGIMRLIVRECPSPKWNPPGCEEDCPVCYNGGVCDDKTGVCVCPVGFMGEHCEKGCESSNWGRYCEMNCSSSNPTCLGTTFCPPDPVGCSCYRGYTGNDCYTECYGMNYGINCLQTCYCEPQDCDNSRGCRENATCLEGYEGPGCQKTVLSRCTHGMFGILCNYPCHCKDDGNCNTDGSCDVGCHEAWAGHDCSIALPYRSVAPTIVTSTLTTLTIDASWVPGEDYGTGTILTTRVWYKTSSLDTFTSVTLTDSDSFITIDNILPASNVEFYAQHSRLVAGIETVGPPSPHGYADMKCSRPLDAPTVTLKAAEDHYIYLEIQSVSDAYERIQCNDILRYQLRLSTYDRAVQILNTTNRDISITSKCVPYDVYARVVNNRDIAGDWGERLKIQPLGPGAPNITSISTTASSVTINWSPPEDAILCDVIGYQVRITSNLFEISQFHTNNTYINIDDNINPETEYNVKVAAMNVYGYGTFSQNIVIQTDANKPTTQPAGGCVCTQAGTEKPKDTIDTFCDWLEAELRGMSEEDQRQTMKRINDLIFKF
ncbi:uncharacterized protein [Antedon mediterranea]|uniref:uncharacterized protein n=1 Tax=Antedon mediterranea TaxID=105859 RepID=UPI003AF67707